MQCSNANTYIGGGYISRSLVGAKKLTISDFSYTVRSGRCEAYMQLGETNIPLSNGTYVLNGEDTFVARSTAISNVVAEQVRLYFRLTVEY